MAKVDVYVKYYEMVVEDCISCDWCSEWEHRSCASIQERTLSYVIMKMFHFFLLSLLARCLKSPLTLQHLFQT